MKNINLYLVCILVAILNNIGRSEVLLSGNLRNYASDYITISTIQSFQLTGDISQVQVRDFKFIYPISIEGPVIVHIDFNPTGLNQWQRIVLFAENEQQISFEIDFATIDEKGMPKCIFKGDNAKGHGLFYEFQFFALRRHIGEFEKIIAAGHCADSVYQQIMAELREFTDPYKVLLSDGLIDSIYYKTSTDFVKSALIRTCLSSLYRRALDLANKNEKVKLKLIKLLLEQCPKFEDVNILAGRQFTFCGECVRYRKLASMSSTEGSLLPDTSVFLHGKEYRLSSPFRDVFYIEDSQVQEFYFASTLHFFYQTMIGMVENYTNEFEFFVRAFPSSLYIPMLYNDQEASIRLAANDTSEDWKLEDAVRHYEKWSSKILEIPSEMSSLDVDLGSIDLGVGVFYVDIWATWCKPCLQEMRYNYKVDSLLDVYGFERLYISVDDSTRVDKWIEDIQVYNLGGYHIMASNALIKYIVGELGLIDLPLTLPRYLIMKDGIVIDKVAPRPSKFVDLQSKIEEIVGQ